MITMRIYFTESHSPYESEFQFQVRSLRSSLVFWWLGLGTFTAGFLGPWVQSLVNELRSRKPHGMSLNKQSNRNEVSELTVPVLGAA